MFFGVVRCLFCEKYFLVGWCLVEIERRALSDYVV